MKSGIQNRIQELFIQSSTFTKNDVLVNILPGKDIFVFAGETFVLFEDISGIVKSANNSIKESGTNPLCKTSGLIHWQIDEVEVQSPLLITPIYFSVDKVRNQVDLNWEEETSFVNPFIINRLSTYYEIHDELPTNLEELINKLNEFGFDKLDSETSFLGIIHHHRHQLLKELELLELYNDYSNPLLELMGEISVTKAKEISPKLLLPADPDHRTCFQLYEAANLCIEGPPGTGKSQVLTNFIGKGLIDQESMLVVSEKKSALDVLDKKLAEFNLNHLVVVGTDKMDNKNFTNSIKKSWEFFENYKPQPISISTRNEREANLQFVLDIINQPELIGGIDFTTFRTISENITLDEFEYIPDAPSLELFIKNESCLVKLFDKELNYSLSIVRGSVLAQKQLKQLSEKNELLVSKARSFKDKGYSSLSDINKIKRQLGVVQLFENELVKQYSAIYQPNSKEQKQFVRLSKKWKKLTSTKEQFEANQTTWKIIPSFEEYQDLSNQIRGGFFNRRKAKKRWDEISTVTYSEQSKSIDELLLYFKTIKDLQQVKNEFISLGVEAELIPSLSSSLTLFSEEKWALYQQIPTELKVNSQFILRDIEEFESELGIYFNLDENLPIEDQLAGFWHCLHYFIEWQDELSSIDSATLKIIGKHSSYHSFKKQVLGSHYSNFKTAYPRFADFTMNDLSSKIEACVLATNEESQITSQHILNNTHQQFVDYTSLLSTAARQLNDEQKELKRRLKKGKSILIKEFNKSRQHISIRELYQSEAREWIQLLKPVWMCNPYLVASLFPLEKELFDQCIFDEASQLILQGGIGSIQRSKRVIIAGDTQQMEPTSYFKASVSEQVSLLQHAQYYYKKQVLSHHYRSVHPMLIEFSNRYFYENKLMVFPSAGLNDTPIHFTYVSNGVFSERQNTEEAKIVAAIIKEKLKSQENLGVVAFSQPQLDAIWKELSVPEKEKLEQRIDNNTAFFKTLEKVQGDECHSLIISFGYAKTIDGEFALRFGPMNLETGRKRLNVLVSRASHHIDFVASVRADDFKISTNESIELLRKWFTFLENLPQNKAVEFPFETNPKIEGNQLFLSSIHLKTKDAIELINLHSVLESRGWKIHYT